MKNIVLLLLVFSSSVVFSQRFTFDFATHYEYYFNNVKYERVSYSNTDNPNLFLYFYTNEGQRTAKLVDIEQMQNHFFNVKREITKEGEILHFEYIRSEKKEENKFHKENPSYYDFKTIKTDSLSKTVLLQFYTNKKRKKVYYSLELKVVPADANYFSNFRMATMHGASERKELDYKENGLVVEAINSTKKKKKLQAKLLYSEKIQFELVVDPSIIK